MGYDLHITRKAQWSDEEGPVITEAEWRALIAADSELAIDTETYAGDDWVFAAWNGELGALSFHDGDIKAKYPDLLLIAKMVRIAQALDAHVQGDDGELYREDGSSYEPGSGIPPGAPLLQAGSCFAHRANSPNYASPSRE